MKPLHVRVAEKLGFTGSATEFTRYDLDWETTGPLIELFKISLTYNGKHWFSHVLVDEDDEDGPNQSCPHIGENAGFAPCADRADRPLQSVCQLILELPDDVVRRRDP